MVKVSSVAFPVVGGIFRKESPIDFLFHFPHAMSRFR